MAVTDNEEQGNDSLKEHLSVILRSGNSDQTTSEDNEVSTDESVGEQENQIEPGNQEDEAPSAESAGSPEVRNQQPEEIAVFSEMLRNSKNIILHGAPGTGKTYLAKEIAAYIISKGHCIRYDDLSDEQKRQAGFVQFHPSYDYTDFVEGLRPTLYKEDGSKEGGSIVFKLQDGIFKEFVARARNDYEEYRKQDKFVDTLIKKFFSSFNIEEKSFTTISGESEFKIKEFSGEKIVISIPNKLINLNTEKLKSLIFTKISKVKEIAPFFNNSVTSQDDCYYFAILQEIRKYMEENEACRVFVSQLKPIKLIEYVFIIDEINRGEISKIFGELFFSIDPGYRGEDGAVSTQYANMHEDKNEKFYIPENVYIIGTMNDIDRSVESFDFAMRRRFRFVELKANKRCEMLKKLGKFESQARQRMNALNKVIANVECLNENYQIGPAYFLKLKDLNFNFDLLWTDYLQPLLHDYIQGMHNEKKIMGDFEKAYGYKKPTEDDANESAKN